MEEAGVAERLDFLPKWAAKAQHEAGGVAHDKSGAGFAKSGGFGIEADGAGLEHAEGHGDDGAGRFERAWAGGGAGQHADVTAAPLDGFDHGIEMDRAAGVIDTVPKVADERIVTGGQAPRAVALDAVGRLLREREGLGPDEFGAGRIEALDVSGGGAADPERRVGGIQVLAEGLVGRGRHAGQKGVDLLPIGGFGAAVADAEVIGGEFQCRQEAGFHGLPDKRMAAVHEFRAEFDGDGYEGIVEGVDPAADAAAGFQHDHRNAGTGKGAGGGKPSRARADYEDVRGHSIRVQRTDSARDSAGIFARLRRVGTPGGLPHYGSRRPERMA